jgi:hypothetical protein
MRSYAFSLRIGLALDANWWSGWLNKLLWSLFAVGNALKFTHVGSVTVRVRVAAEHTTTTPLSSDDGKNDDNFHL